MGNLVQLNKYTVLKTIIRIRRKSVRWNGLQINVKDRVVLRPVQQKNPRKSQNLVPKKKVIVNKRKRKIRRRSAKKTILETYVLIHVAILVYLLLYQTLSVMHKNLIK